ncbi:MAG: uL15 family ribosomal protein [Patescibacteria group bacterium]
MQFHHLQRSSSSRRARRIGRGGKRGTYSGRGIKGQRARAGAKFRPAERDIIKKIPKLRGYRFTSFRAQPAAVNLDVIERFFKPGETVDPSALLKKRIIRSVNGRTPRVKILGRGGSGKQFVFKDVKFSGSAAEKIKTKNEK